MTENLTSNSANPNDSPATALQPDNALSLLLVTLLKGVIYQDADGNLWQSLIQLQARVRDYFSLLGLTLVLDESEGYAFLRSLPESDDDNRLPRLIARRPLSFPVSLLLALLRKKMLEFDASGEATRLILSREEIIELLRVFLPESSNEARLIDQCETHINKIVELGFLRRLKPNSAVNGTNGANFEVRRILKAFIDAEWLNEFDARLAAYHRELQGEPTEDHNA